MHDNLKQKAADTEQSVKSKFKGMAGELEEEAMKFGRTIKEGAAQSLESAQSAVADYYQKGQEKMAAVGSEFEDQVKANPLKAMLIFAGIGAGIGFALAYARGKR